ncbi:MAG: cytochrome b/b6 domain-containing protein [Burkholderiales bacterium]|nr:cytochrome b/b6 domain-containing protein [Burkholderiales bacterium]
MKTSAGTRRRMRVWDLPVRVFHWMLVILIATSWISAEIGGNAMQIHQWSGLTVLMLILFRIAWGFFGGTHARFSSFVRSPAAAVRYGIGLIRGSREFHPGHNPLGGWMVMALLLSLLIQAGTGLFANDDIMLEGPLAARVSKETSDLLTVIHEVNFNVLLGLIAVHILAALFYLVVKRENLILPMITGDKLLHDDDQSAAPRSAPLWLAALLLGASAAAVWLLVAD